MSVMSGLEPKKLGKLSFGPKTRETRWITAYRFRARVRLAVLTRAGCGRSGLGGLHWLLPTADNSLVLFTVNFTHFLCSRKKRVRFSASTFFEFMNGKQYYFGGEKLPYFVLKIKNCPVLIFLFLNT